MSGMSMHPIEKYFLDSVEAKANTRNWSGFSRIKPIKSRAHALGPFGNRG